MSEEPRTYPHGATSWVDLSTPDLASARAFYGGLLGWTFEDRMPADAAYHYLIAGLDGEDAAGLGGPDDDARWHTYLAVDDTDAAVDAFVAAGGTLVSGPEEPGPAGRTAALRDPQGALFHLWQAGRRLGAQAVNRPGGWVFSHLHTDDVAGASAFYGSVLGWQVTDAGFPGAVALPGYADHLAATSDPGIHERNAGAPEGYVDVVAAVVPAAEDEAPAWQVWFAVADRDAATARVEELGGSVVSTTDGEWTRDAVVRDPQGAELVLSQYAPPGS